MIKRLIPITVILIVLCSSIDALSQSPSSASIRKPQMSDTIRANVYADNSFILYINGELVAVDSIAFVPHQVGPKQPYFDSDFKGAKFIWTDDIALDNVVLFRHVVKSPPDGKQRVDFRNLNNVIPENPPRGQGRQEGQRRNNGAKR
jgi:hypothetical protein